jgi:hypothetical protein
MRRVRARTRRAAIDGEYLGIADCGGGTASRYRPQSATLDVARAEDVRLVAVS